jgi:hypothetical protein
MPSAAAISRLEYLGSSAASRPPEKLVRRTACSSASRRSAMCWCRSASDCSRASAAGSGVMAMNRSAPAGLLAQSGGQQRPLGPPAIRLPSAAPAGIGNRRFPEPPRGGRRFGKCLPIPVNHGFDLRLSTPRRLPCPQCRATARQEPVATRCHPLPPRSRRVATSGNRGWQLPMTIASRWHPGWRWWRRPGVGYGAGTGPDGGRAG